MAVGMAEEEIVKWVEEKSVQRKHFRRLHVTGSLLKTYLFSCSVIFERFRKG